MINKKKMRPGILFYFFTFYADRNVFPSAKAAIFEYDRRTRKEQTGSAGGVSLQRACIRF